LYLKFYNTSEKLTRDSQRNEEGIKQKGESKWEKAEKKLGIKGKKIKGIMHLFYCQ
jgi:hypothetical protein